MLTEITSFFRRMCKLIFSRWPFALFLVPYIIFVSQVYSNYGIAIDEPIEYTFGEMLYARNFGKDPQLIRDFAVEGEHSREIWAYNHFHAMMLHIINDSRDINVYHLLNFLFASAAYYLTYELVYQSTKERFLSLLGPVILFFTPRFFGDIASNVKDPVFATYYLLALVVLVIMPKTKNWFLGHILVGIAIGFAAAARIVGYTLVIINAFSNTKYKDIYHVIKQSPPEQMKQLILIVLSMTLVIVVAVIVHGIQMPFVAADPLHNIPRLLQIGRDYPWNGEMLYKGNIISSSNLPWHYLFIWIGVTTPIFILVLWLISHLFIKNRVVAILSLTVWLNVLIYLIIKPNIYDGMRHYLFLVVIMAVLAAIAWVKLWQKARQIFKVLLIAVVGIFVFLTSWEYAQLHPYEYIYFNKMTGGLSGASEKFETDYWGVSYKEAVEWLHANSAESDVITVGLCGNQEAKIYFDNNNFDVQFFPHCEGITQDTDYVFAMGRNNEWNKVNGEVVYQVDRRNVPLVKIIVPN